MMSTALNRIHLLRHARSQLHTASQSMARSANEQSSLRTTIRVGDSARATKSFSAADVKTFALLSGDDNPLHLDEAFAKETRFGRCIVHGSLINSVISGVLGTKLPGTGAVYLSQTVNFKKPLYIDEPVTAIVTVLALDPHKPIAEFSTVCEKQDGTVVMDGAARVMLPKTMRKVAD